MITQNGFQSSAFQRNGFQMPDAGGSGGWLPYFLARSRRLAREKREKKGEPELAFVQLPTTVALRLAAKPIVTDLSAMAATLAPRPDVELEQFREFMQMIAELEEI